MTPRVAFQLGWFLAGIVPAVFLAWSEYRCRKDLGRALFAFFAASVFVCMPFITGYFIVLTGIWWQVELARKERPQELKAWMMAFRVILIGAPLLIVGRWVFDYYVQFFRPQ